MKDTLRIGIVGNPVTVDIRSSPVAIASRGNLDVGIRSCVTCGTLPRKLLPFGLS